MKIAIFLIVLSRLALPLAAQWLQRPTAGIPRTADGKPNLTAPTPHTADGKPDLSGIWASLCSLADYKADYGRPSVQALVQQRMENYGKDNPAFQCLPKGPAYSTALVSTKQIVQTPAMIVMLNDDLTYRRIFMDGGHCRPIRSRVGWDIRLAAGRGTHWSSRVTGLRTAPRLTYSILTPKCCI